MLKQFPLDEDVIAWISENISAQSYRINQLRLQFSLNKLEEIGPDNINGFATADAAAIQFHPDLPPVQCDGIKITFQDDRLSFALENPMYRGKNLEGSHVYIDNIIKPHSVLAIHIKTESRLDDIILTLLEKYDFKLPLRQISGLTQAEINLLFNLPGFTLTTNGIFTTGSGAWTWRDIALQTQGASVQLADNKITIKQADISYKDILHTQLSGLIDTSSRHAGLVNDIEQLNFTAKGATILQAAQLKLPLEVDFSHDAILIEIEQIKTSITLED